MTWKLKTCPRCQGDLFVDKDLDGWFEQCLQCSYRKELRPIAVQKSAEQKSGTCDSRGREASLRRGLRPRKNAEPNRSLRQ